MNTCAGGKELLNESELVRSLLELASVESGHITLNFEHIEPAGVVAEVVKRMTPLARKKGLALVEDGRRSPAPAIVADRSLVERTLVNLVDNAIKYTPAPGTVTVWAEDARTSGKCPGPGALFAVNDTGPGLPEEDLERVFERFYRSSKDRSRGTGGTGLGLSLVKHWAGAHGGKAWAESEEGRGATFCVYFPCLPPQAAPK